MASRTAVISVLKFKNLNAQLTDKEFDSFISDLRRDVGREKIVSLLCTQFLKDLHNPGESGNEVDDEGSHPLKAMMRITSDIIRNRDSKSILCTKPMITNMPSSLIGNIASFLKQKKYIDFSMVNRKMFVDCNTPNTLQKLNLKKITDYRSISLQNYHQIKWLKFNLKQISEFKNVNEQRFGACKRVRTLIIKAEDSRISDLVTLINDSSPCFSTLTSVSLIGLSLDSDRLIRVLSKFAELKHLKLINVRIDGQLSPDSLSLVCTKIKELTYISGNVRTHVHRVLDSWKSRLDTLTLPDWNALPNTPDLSLVKRLCICAMAMQRIHALLKSAKSLQGISWIPNTNTPPNPSLTTFTTQQIEDIIKNCIVDQEALEYVYVSTRGYFQAICSGIQCGLYLTKKRKRKQLEIALKVDVREISNADEFMCNISRIIQVLGISDIDQWILCVDANCDHAEQRQSLHWNTMKMVVKDLVDSLNFSTRILRGTERGFVIGTGLNVVRHAMWWQRGQPFTYY